MTRDPIAECGVFLAGLALGLLFSGNRTARGLGLGVALVAFALLFTTDGGFFDGL